MVCGLGADRGDDEEEDDLEPAVGDDAVVEAHGLGDVDNPKHHHPQQHQHPAAPPDIQLEYTPDTDQQVAALTSMCRK